MELVILQSAAHHEARVAGHRRLVRTYSGTARYAAPPSPTPPPVPHVWLPTGSRDRPASQEPSIKALYPPIKENLSPKSKTTPVAELDTVHSGIPRSPGF